MAAVVDGAGAPVPNAVATILFTDSAGKQTLRVTSGADGKFTASGINAPQVDSMSVEAEGYERSDISTYVPLPLDDVFTITLNRLAGVHMRVLERRGEGSQPVPFSGTGTLYLSRRSDAATTTGSATTEGFETVWRREVTVRDGSESISGIVPGVYRAALVAGGEYAESGQFTVQPSVASDATIVLGQRQRLLGAVKSAASQQPVPRAALSILMTGRPPEAGTPAAVSGAADERGDFTIGGLVPGTYALTVGALGFTTKTFEQIPVLAGDSPAPPATYLLPEGQSAVEVAVLDPDGRPIGGAPLVLYSVGASQPRTFFAQADSSGTWRFEPVPGGRFMVAVTHPQVRSRQLTVDVVVGEAERKRVEVRFGRPQRLTGRAKRDGRPYGGLISFTLRGTAFSRQFAKSDAEGFFTVELEPGDYVAGRDDSPGSTLVTVREGQTADLEVDLK
jgi:hypothetical protein